MIGRADVKSTEYHELFLHDEPVTGGAIWLSKCWCRDCKSLFECEEGTFLRMEVCSLCHSKDLIRPPAYGPIQLSSWCERRRENMSPIVQIVPRLSRTTNPNARREIAQERLRTLRMAEQLGRISEPATSGKLLAPMITREHVQTFGSDREPDGLTSEGTGDYNPVGIAEDSRERRDWETRHGIDNSTKVDEILHEIRKEESPNVEKKARLVVKSNGQPE